MSNVGYFLKAEVVDGKAVALSMKPFGDRIMLLGSTMPTSVPSGVDQYGSFVVYPEKGKDGIVAVVVRLFSSDKKQGCREEFVFLKVSWKEKEGGLFTWIDIDQPWFPADRIGQLVSYAVEVVIKGRRFSSSSSPYSKLARVSDGDLLCRYLFGLASPDEVVHAAIQEKLEVKAMEQIPVIQKALDRMRVLADQLKKDGERKDALFAELQEINSGWKRLIDHFRSLSWFGRLFYRFHQFEVAKS